jgi:magnesium chelatase family protein
MLARRLPTILPPLRSEDALEVTRIRSVTGRPVYSLVEARPFRSPHHTISTAALVGGGSGRPRPGEVTWAHRGVLFLDELGEFAPSTLDAMRQPLEERRVRIARQGASVEFPAAFQLVACSNPCPCGVGPPACRCSELQVARYRRRLSTPLLDRFDVRVRVTAPAPTDRAGECSADVRRRVAEASERQRRRYDGRRWAQNAHVPAAAIEETMPLSADSADAWHSLIEDFQLTGRGAACLRRVARTLADLDGAARIGIEHLDAASLLRGDVP